MHQKGFASTIFIVVVVILVIGGAYWYLHQSTQKQFFQNNLSTSTNQEVASVTSSENSEPINLISLAISTEEIDDYYENNLGTSTSLSVIPVYQLKPTSEDPSPPGSNPGSYGLVVYDVGSTTLSFYNSPYTVGYRGLTLSRNGIDISTSSVSIAGNNFQPEHGVNLFSYNGKQYLLVSGMDCGKGGCAAYVDLYVLNTENNFIKLLSYDSNDYDGGTAEDWIGGIVTNQDTKNIYILLTSDGGNGNTALVLDDNFKLITTVTGSAGKGVNPPDVVPPQIEQILESPNG